jgi:hypothetical protein
MKNYFEINPVAAQFMKSGSVFESQKTDALLSNGVKMFCDGLYNCIYAYAPKRDKNTEVVTKKFESITTSKNLKSMLSQAIELAEDNDLVTPMYSEPRRLSVDSMQKFSDALLRSTEIDNNNTKTIVKELKDCLKAILHTIGEINDEEKKLNESFGFAMKTQDLKNRINDLLVKSEGKEGSKGYHKNWKNIFTAFDQKIKSLSERPGIAEKDYVLLDTLKKEIDKHTKSFNQSIVDSFDKVKSGIEDDEAYEKYGDVISGLKKGTEIYNRCIASEESVKQEMDDKKSDNEESTISAIFPLKSGDSDEKPRFKGYEVISLLRDALSSVPEFEELISKDKKSTFGKNLKVVIQVIQKQTGNNNPTGEVDAALYTALKNSDWIEDDHRAKMDRIILDIIKDKKK